ncbi:MAG: hypothetical protein QM642_11590, partial [Edaphocola sp.]
PTQEEVSGEFVNFCHVVKTSMLKFGGVGSWPNRCERSRHRLRKKYFLKPQNCLRLAGSK